jgi:hypothetical protein
MDCPQVRNWLLQAEDPRPERCPSAELTHHLRTCAACDELAWQLLQLEQSWREIPIPDSVERARAEFLEQFPAHSATPIPTTVPLRRRWAPPSWAVAAVLLLAVGLGTALLSTPRATASAEVVDRLIDWNLDLAQAPSPTERSRIYTEQVDAMRGALRRAKLPGSEQELAEKLLENGSWLAENNDPTAEADRFNDVADKLLERLDAARARGTTKELRRLARSYGRVAKYGIDAKLAKAQASGALNFERKRKLERVILRDAKRRQALEALLERTPEATRKEIKKALKLPRKERQPRATGVTAPTP